MWCPSPRQPRLPPTATKELLVSSSPSSSSTSLPSLSSCPTVTAPPPSPTPPATATEIDRIITVTTGFLTALSSKSPPDFDKYCIRAGGMSLWPPPPMLPRFCTIGAFVEKIATVKDEIDERIWDPEVKVSEWGDLAAVWAPFRSKINGVVDHVGVELFVLHKVEGRWKVTAVADSCRWPTEEERMLLG